MTASVESILAAAHAEWNHWGQSRWNLKTGQRSIQHTDDEPDFARLVIDRYCAIGGGSPTLDQISNDDYAWSAVGISAAMKMAGFTRHEFPFTESHSKYIRHFVAARVNGDEAAPYWGFRLDEEGGEPDVGDIVAYARGDRMSHEKAARFFDAKKSYLSHGDIVVDKRVGEIDVIGFNVLDSVTMKTLPLRDDGHIGDRTHHWFAILKHRLQSSD
jgi:hypothetical protein